jgi:GTP-binding protein HflX
VLRSLTTGARRTQGFGIRNLFGDTFGLKPSQIRKLEATYRRRVNPHDAVSPELARHLTEISREIHRQVGALITRRGEIEWVIVGDASRLLLPDIGRARVGQARLRGLRLIHTHLKSEPLSQDDLTDLALLRLDLVAALGVSSDGLPEGVSFAHLLPQNPEGALWKVEQVRSLQDLPMDLMAQIAALEGELAAEARAHPVTGAGRALLVAASTQGREAAQQSLHELRELARAAGVEVLDEVLQLRHQLDARTLVGHGKLQQIALRSMQLLADVLIFDCNLTPAQSRGIAEETSLKILDRTQLILDIFAQRATSRDGKLQVELAQLRYRMPRLAGKGDSLSRLAGGIGGRGPGETQLEIDRRRVRERIARLEREIEGLSRIREVRRSRRSRKQVPAIALIGYTNAGKSTLLNALTHSDARVQDQLFSTLDPTSRRLRFPRDREVVLTDTVGFLRDLPKDLVAAFRATLEELRDADLLIHVLDGADPEYETKLRAVEVLIKQLGLAETPLLLAVNKADRLPEGQAAQLALQLGGVALSAERGEGMVELLQRADALLWRGEPATETAPRADEASELGAA